MENHVVELVQPRHTLIGENSILEIPQFLHRLEEMCIRDRRVYRSDPGQLRHPNGQR